MKAHIYLEGGGGKDLNSRCREGFNKLLRKCGFEGRMPKLTASGGRDSVYNDFKTAQAGASGQDYIAMLVDSEDTVKDVHSPWAHLLQREGWHVPLGATDEQVLLMTTCMETWIAADRSALSAHYGKCLQVSALPAGNNLESQDRDTVQKRLSHATRNCIGPYEKGGKVLRNTGRDQPRLHRASSAQLQEGTGFIGWKTVKLLLPSWQPHGSCGTGRLFPPAHQT